MGEDAHLNKETMKAMKTSAQAMKQTIKEDDLDKADELMEDINEAMDQVNEMNEAMSQPLGQMMDADELLQDMEEPKQQQQNNNYDSNIDAMPNVPTGNIKKKQQDEEDELAELEMMM